MIERSNLNVGLALCYHINQENRDCFSSLKEISDLYEEGKIPNNTPAKDSINQVMTIVENTGKIFNKFLSMKDNESRILETNNNKSEKNNEISKINLQKNDLYNDFIKYKMNLPEIIKVELPETKLNVEYQFITNDIYTAIQKIYEVVDNNSTVTFEECTEIEPSSNKERKYLRIVTPLPKQSSSCLIS